MLQADEVLTTPGGASFTAASGWWITDASGALELVAPEGDLTTNYVEVKGDTGRHAITAAWQKVRPGFDLAEVRSDDHPGHNGWDAVAQIEYVTPATEQRYVLAVALGKATSWYVFLVDGSIAASGRRGAQLYTMFASLKAHDMTRESWATKQANKLDATRLAAIDSFVDAAMNADEVPGAALAIVQDGKVIHERGFGVRELGKSAKVDPHTLFLTGSTGKSLMTLMMARAVDARIFTWDTHVTTMLPDFALGSEIVTKALLVRDTVCACTGMPRQDLEMLFEYKGITPEQRLASMKSMALTTGFGETFQYSNMIVMAGGYAAGHAFFPMLALGPAFDRAMQDQVFGPLAMKDTTYDFQRAARASHATPHARAIDGKLSALPLSNEAWVTPVRPAGGQWSSVHDYTRVLQLELGNGELDGKRVISERALLARRDPQVKISDERSYGMGLIVGTEAGVPIVEHSGATAGFTTTYFWLPEHNVGAVFVANVHATPVPDLVQRRILELVFDGEPLAERDLAEATKQRKKGIDDELALLAPELDQAWFARLAGTWVAPGLGRVDIKLVKGQIVVDAGEWKVNAAQRIFKDGTRTIETIGATFAGIDFVPAEQAGKLVLVVNDEQHVYVFERAP
jgi:CubicO group peptidase (beta-lactamase class C family)